MVKVNKIVVNKCYGGYGLSSTAVMWLANHGHAAAKAEVETWVNEAPRYLYLDHDRMDPLVVQCVEALKDAASGSCANLEVVTFEGNQYRICEYDGLEYIETPDSVPWSTVPE